MRRSNRLNVRFFFFFFFAALLERSPRTHSLVFLCNFAETEVETGNLRGYWPSQWLFMAVQDLCRGKRRILVCAGECVLSLTFSFFFCSVFALWLFLWWWWWWFFIAIVWFCLSICVIVIAAAGLVCAAHVFQLSVLDLWLGLWGLWSMSTTALWFLQGSGFYFQGIPLYRNDCSSIAFHCLLFTTGRLFSILLEMLECRIPFISFFFCYRLTHSAHLHYLAPILFFRTFAPLLCSVVSGAFFSFFSTVCVFAFQSSV